MFLTKQHFDESIRVMESYDTLMDDKELRLAIAEGFAKELFEGFDSMREDEKAEVLSMIIEDMPVSIYSIH